MHASVLEVSSFLQDEDPFELFDGGVEASFGLVGRTRRTRMGGKEGEVSFAERERYERATRSRRRIRERNEQTNFLHRQIRILQVPLESRSSVLVLFPTQKQTDESNKTISFASSLLLSSRLSLPLPPSLPRTVPSLHCSQVRLGVDVPVSESSPSPSPNDSTPLPSRSTSEQTSTSAERASRGSEGCLGRL